MREPLERAQAKLERYRASVLKAAVEGTLTEDWRTENPPEETGEALLRQILVDGGSPALKLYGDGEALPLGWGMASVGSILREPLRNGKSAKASPDGRGVRTLTLTAVTEGDFSEKNTKITVANPKAVQDLWLQTDDIFVERSNAPELVGLALRYVGPSNYAIFPDLLIRIRCDLRLSAAYLELALQAPQARGYFRTRAKGSAGSMPKINQGTISELVLPIPPRTEQNTIAARVAALLSETDRLVETLRVAIMRGSATRQSILRRAFEGGLVPQDPEDEPASVLLERIRAERDAEGPKKKLRTKNPQTEQESLDL